MKYKIDQLPEILEQIKKDTRYPWEHIAKELGCTYQMLCLYRRRIHVIPVKVAKRVQEVFKIKILY